jgi:putative transposase
MRFNTTLMCSCLGVSRSGYYDWLKRLPSKREQENKVIDAKIITLNAEHRGRYGSPRITQELHDEGIACSENRVAKRMSALGIHAKGKRKFKATTDSTHQLPIYENVLNRDFYAASPNEKWISDITYVWTMQGWLYLCVYIDLHSRSVIGWSMSNRINKQLVCDALMMALWRRGFPKGVIVHSDRGSQYASKKYQKMLLAYGLIGSMSRKGNCWDNSVAESFFHTIKCELMYDIIYQTREQAKQSIFEYIETYYNKKRKHSYLGYLTPDKFENKSYNLVSNGVR